MLPLFRYLVRKRLDWEYAPSLRESCDAFYAYDQATRDVKQLHREWNERVDLLQSFLPLWEKTWRLKPEPMFYAEDRLVTNKCMCRRHNTARVAQAAEVPVGLQRREHSAPFPGGEHKADEGYEYSQYSLTGCATSAELEVNTTVKEQLVEYADLMSMCRSLEESSCERPLSDAEACKY